MRFPFDCYYYRWELDEPLTMARAQINECVGISIGTAVEHLFAFVFKCIRQDVEEHGRVGKADTWI